MADQPNGLATLAQARQRARRSMPPPRHPAAAAPRTLELPDSPLEKPTAEASHAPDTTSDAAPPAATGSPPVVDAAAQAPDDAAVEPPVKLTFYIDQDIDRYLEHVRVHGLLSRPRIDISRSAVVRLALRRLRAEMTAEQVNTLLANQPTDPTRTGRKRR